MKYSIINKVMLNPFKMIGDNISHYDILNEDNQKRYCAAIRSSYPDKIVIYDHRNQEKLMNKSFYIQNGYAYQTNDQNQNTTMHSIVMHLANIKIDNGHSIDHINQYKTDNRLENLRVATQSEQNSNRPTRQDKIKPCEELQQAGVKELPRYVRWDKTEKKFIIEKHPTLLKQVENGERRKATMSGSKSNKLSIMQKYQDILARLEELNFTNTNKESLEEFKAKKLQLSNEYEAICECIKIYEGETIEKKEPEPEPEPEITPIKRTAKGKKSVSRLPENCGVHHEDIPKYCYYSPATEKRSDKFVIERHPTLLKQGKTQWSTTGKSSLTTRQKFDLLMEKYKELEET